MEEGVSAMKDALGLNTDEVDDTQAENINQKVSLESQQESPQKPKEIGTKLNPQNSFFMEYASNFLTESGPFKEVRLDLYN